MQEFAITAGTDDLINFQAIKSDQLIELFRKRGGLAIVDGAILQLF